MSCWGAIIHWYLKKGRQLEDRSLWLHILVGLYYIMHYCSRLVVVYVCLQRHAWWEGGESCNWGRETSAGTYDISRPQSFPGQLFGTLILGYCHPYHVLRILWTLEGCPWGYSLPSLDPYIGTWRPSHICYGLPVPVYPRVKNQGTPGDMDFKG